VTSADARRLFGHRLSRDAGAFLHPQSAMISSAPGLASLKPRCGRVSTTPMGPVGGARSIGIA